MAFIKSAIPPDRNPDQAYYLCFIDGDILLEKTGEAAVFPLLTADKAKECGFNEQCFIGWLEGKPCYSVIRPERIASGEYKMVGLKDFFLEAEPELARIAGYARQIPTGTGIFVFVDDAQLRQSCSPTSVPVDAKFVGS